MRGPQRMSGGWKRYGAGNDSAWNTNIASRACASGAMQHPPTPTPAPVLAAAPGTTHARHTHTESSHPGHSVLNPNQTATSHS